MTELRLTGRLLVSIPRYEDLIAGPSESDESQSSAANGKPNDVGHSHRCPGCWLPLSSTDRPAIGTGQASRQRARECRSGPVSDGSSGLSFFSGDRDRYSGTGWPSGSPMTARWPCSAPVLDAMARPLPLTSTDYSPRAAVRTGWTGYTFDVGGLRPVPGRRQRW